MKIRLRNTFIIIAAIVIALILPVLFKAKGHPPLVGPDLSEFDYTEISFTNRFQDLKLAGMLFLPEGDGPFPVAVIIHGSGTSRRNNVWYLSVAQYLQQNGIAVLLPDKRGSEQSEGAWLGSSFEDLATDTLSAVEYIKMQNMFSYTSIGLIGMSQGGWIAPVAASQSQDISFVVSMSGAAVTSEEQLLHEEIYNIAPYTYTFIAKLLAPLTTRTLMKREFFIPTAGFDPIPYWQKVEVPVLFALGGDDTNVPVEASIQRLEENGLDHFMIKTYPGGGHAIRDTATNRVSGEFLKDVSEIISRSR